MCMLIIKEVDNLVMETERAKRNRMSKGKLWRKGSNEPITMAEDRISQLPDCYSSYFFIPSHHLYRLNESSFQALDMVWVSTPLLYFEGFKDVTFHRMIDKEGMFLRFWIIVWNVAGCISKFQTCS